MKYAPLYSLIAIVSLTLPCAAAAKSKVVPGGANQVAGVQAAYPNIVFNGFIRIKPKYFGPARPQDNIIEKPADANTKVMVFSGTISDGSTKPYLDNPLIVLADADGVTQTAQRAAERNHPAASGRCNTHCRLLGSQRLRPRSSHVHVPKRALQSDSHNVQALASMTLQRRFDRTSGRERATKAWSALSS